MSRDGPSETERPPEVYEEPESQSPPLQEAIGAFLSNTFIWALVIIILLLAVLVGVFGTQFMSFLNSFVTSAGQ